MANANEFGKFYWCAKVPGAISQDGQIYLYADRVEFTPSGDVLFWRGAGLGEQGDHLNLSLARGCWLVVYAASIIDRDGVAVDRWGEDAGDS